MSALVAARLGHAARAPDGRALGQAFQRSHDHASIRVSSTVRSAPQRASPSSNGRRTKTHIVLQIARHNATSKGFEVLPRPWIVERTCAWIIKNRRFARDNEQLTAVAKTLIIIAACATLVKRWP